MKILLTGATGTIGGALIPRLLAAGHTLVHVGRAKLPIHHPCLEWVIADFSGGEALVAGPWSGCEAALHLANLTKEDPALDRTVSAELFGLAAAAGVKNFFYASSIRVYGNAYGVITEEATPAPLPSDLYGQAKLATEGVLRGLTERAPGTKLRILRIGHVITPENRAKLPRSLGARFLLLWGRGYPHYIAVADVVDALLFLLEKQTLLSQPEVLHLTRDEENSRYADYYGSAVTRLLALPLWATRMITSSLPGAREARCSRILPKSLSELGWSFLSPALSREDLGQ